MKNLRRSDLPRAKDSFKVSTATSPPILWRNLKQSATVFAGLKRRTVTPPSLCFSTPAESVSSEKRKTLSGG